MACEKVGSPEITSVRSQEVDGASLPWSLVLYWANLSELAVSNIFILNPTWGNDPIWLQSYFSNGLKPPTSYLLGVLSCFDPGIADSPTWCLVLDFSVSLLSPRPIGMADVVRRNPKRWWGWNTCKVPILTSGWVNNNNNNKNDNDNDNNNNNNHNDNDNNNNNHNNNNNNIFFPPTFSFVPEAP